MGFAVKLVYLVDSVKCRNKSRNITFNTCFFVVVVPVCFRFQYFVFDFHMAPAMLFDKIITLSVSNSNLDCRCTYILSIYLETVCGYVRIAFVIEWYESHNASANFPRKSHRTMYKQCSVVWFLTLKTYLVMNKFAFSSRHKQL